MDRQARSLTRSLLRATGAARPQLFNAADNRLTRLRRIHRASVLCISRAYSTTSKPAARSLPAAAAGAARSVVYKLSFAHSPTNGVTEGRVHHLPIIPTTVDVDIDGCWNGNLSVRAPRQEGITFERAATL